MRGGRADGCHFSAGGGARRRDCDGRTAGGYYVQRGGRDLVSVQGLPRRPRALVGTGDLRGLRASIWPPGERRLDARGRGDLARTGPRPLVGRRRTPRPPPPRRRTAKRLPGRPRLRRTDSRDAGLSVLPDEPLRRLGGDRTTAHRLL